VIAVIVMNAMCLVIDVLNATVSLPTNVTIGSTTRASAGVKKHDLCVGTPGPEHVFRFRCTIPTMHDNIISMVKSLSIGPCRCQYPYGQASVGWDPVKGTSTMSFEAGPKTECMRCKARTALEADGIEYEKLDGANWTMHNMMGLIGNAACPFAPGVVTAFTGTMSFVPTL
jgi:hypothetical protein